MGGDPIREIACVVCGKPVDLTADLNADENGQVFTGLAMPAPFFFEARPGRTSLFPVTQKRRDVPEHYSYESSRACEPRGRESLTVQTLAKTTLCVSFEIASRY